MQTPTPTPIPYPPWGSEQMTASESIDEVAVLIGVMGVTAALTIGLVTVMVGLIKSWIGQMHSENIADHEEIRRVLRAFMKQY